LYYLKNVLIINKVSYKPDLDLSLCLAIIEEIKVLSNCQQAAIAVAAVQMESCQTGKEQVKYFIGDLNQVSML
jgi:hypothetical protein